MDNLAHSLVGLAASKAGLERLSPHTTTVCILAANAPDSDIIALLWGGRWGFLQHHRGISHSILGTFVLALLIPIVFYLAERLVAHIRARPPKIKLGSLVLASVVVSASHPFMDWTNNYGIRLLLPWSPRWFYGDLVFIVDPFIWFILGVATFLLTSQTRKKVGVWAVLAALVTTVVMFGSASRGRSTGLIWLRSFWIIAMILPVILFKLKAGQRWGEKTAIGALAILIMYWGSLALLHRLALDQAAGRASQIARENNERILNLAAMPTLANPLHWQCAFATDRAAYRFELFLLGGQPAGSGITRFDTPSGSSAPAVASASTDPRAQVFLGFARFPVTRVIDANCPAQTLVQFADLRYTEPGRGAGTFSLEVPVECSPGEIGNDH